VVTTTVDLRILGPVEVVNGERRVSIEGRRTRVLLAMLLVWRNQTVSLDALIEGLWPEGPPSSAKGTLHAHISRLRGALAEAGPLSGNERIHRRPPGYELRTLDGEVDADRFERMLAGAEAALQERRFAGASSALRDALRLVRGPILGECRDDSSVVSVQTRPYVAASIPEPIPLKTSIPALTLSAVDTTNNQLVAGTFTLVSGSGTLTIRSGTTVDNVVVTIRWYTTVTEVGPLGKPITVQVPICPSLSFQPDSSDYAPQDFSSLIKCAGIQS